MHRRHSLRALALAGLTAAALGAPGAQAQALPPGAAHGLDLRELGNGTLRWFGLHVYDARLWAPGPGFRADRPFVLALKYARAFSGDKIAERSVEEMRKVGVGTDAEHRRWKDEMRRVFPDVKSGDELAGLNVPGKGARFFVNGHSVGEIDDPAFSSAFFAIWLDPRTSAKDLRASLLGERS